VAGHVAPRAPPRRDQTRAEEEMQSLCSRGRFKLPLFMFFVRFKPNCLPSRFELIPLLTRRYAARNESHKSRGFIFEVIRGDFTLSTHWLFSFGIYFLHSESLRLRLLL